MNYFIIADNQDITNVGVLYLIESLKIKDCKISNASKKSTLTRLLSEYPDAIVILDYTLFDFSTPNELMILSQRYPLSSWLLLSDDLSDNFLRFIKANDLSFSIVLKSCSTDEICKGINAAVFRDQYICTSVHTHIQTLNKSDYDLSYNNLTNTEKEILKEVALGKTTKEIASDRILSFHTIITHRKNIFRKLGVNNVHEATKYAIRAGIVDVTEYYI